ncbi:MFS general substrate transporter [Ganoderma sinense ZZ0214-1]|uniref:MFS general substrate transporter n=1 Tax=Ganoderma sinense ZZ0214-1 TaxID=1077348 RepID=A0A2G8RSA8_9APHY|nr:MFS general substrate transporter [Ganoderma sinense ZZ0214-1]
MTADPEKNKSTAYSTASSTGTISNDNPGCTINEESRKELEGGQDVEKDAVAESAEDAVPPPDVGENPDGGLRAWLVVIGYALVFIPGLFAGRIFDMGYVKLPLGIASTLLVTATFLTAECKEYWQFLLCQGIAIGLACGVIFGVLMGTPAHWFKHKLGLALGTMALGSSLSGTLYPIIVKNLMEEVGQVPRFSRIVGLYLCIRSHRFKWTMRVLGFIEFALLSVQLVTVDRRLPPKAHTGPFIDVSVFKSVPFSLYTASSFFAFLGIYTLLTYIDVAAESTGIPENLAFYLLSIANACSAIGRLAGGVLVDRLGPLNVMTPATLMAGIMTYIWPFATSTGGNIAVAVVYGIFQGVFVSQIAAPIVRMGRTEDVGLRIGMNFTVIALGAVAGPPISGAINTATGGFKFTGIFAGSAVVVAVIGLIITRISILGRLWGRC